MSLKHFLYYCTFLFILTACSSNSDSDEMDDTSEQMSDSDAMNDDDASTVVEKIKEGDVELFTQSDIDAFGLLQYTRINGQLRIRLGNDITTLRPLITLNYLRDGLLLDRLSELEDLDGLQNITHIGRYIWLSDMYRLINLNNFPITTTQDFNLTISNLRLIKELPSFDNQISGRIIISGLINLEAINGFHNLTTAPLLVINTNPKLASINGFENLMADNTEQEIGIKLNPALSSITPFAKYFGGEQTVVRIEENNLSNYDFLSNLRESKTLELAQGPSENFTVLSPFPNLIKLEFLSLKNFNISSISGVFENLTELNSLSMQFCASLSSIDGFENLNNTVNNGALGLAVSENDILSNYCSLSDWLTNNTIGFIHIENNAYNPTLNDILNGDCSN